MLLSNCKLLRRCAPDRAGSRDLARDPPKGRDPVCVNPAVVRASAVGLSVGLYLLYLLIDFPVTAVAAENIVYVSPHFYKLQVMGLYLAATCIGCFFSSSGTVRLFGALALALFGVAYAFFSVALFSVWCFFAAVLSSMIYVHFRFGRRGQASSVHSA